MSKCFVCSKDQAFTVKLKEKDSTKCNACEGVVTVGKEFPVCADWKTCLLTRPDEFRADSRKKISFVTLYKCNPCDREFRVQGRISLLDLNGEVVVPVKAVPEPPKEGEEAAQKKKRVRKPRVKKDVTASEAANSAEGAQKDAPAADSAAVPGKEANKRNRNRNRNRNKSKTTSNDDAINKEEGATKEGADKAIAAEESSSKDLVPETRVRPTRKRERREKKQAASAASAADGDKKEKKENEPTNEKQENEGRRERPKRNRQSQKSKKSNESSNNEKKNEEQGKNATAGEMNGKETEKEKKAAKPVRERYPVEETILVLGVGRSVNAKNLSTLLGELSIAPKESRIFRGKVYAHLESSAAVDAAVSQSGKTVNGRTLTVKRVRQKETENVESVN
jgi:hypothetical protein